MKLFLNLKSNPQCSKENIDPNKIENNRWPNKPSSTFEIGDKFMEIAKGTPPWSVKLVGVLFNFI